MHTVYLVCLVIGLVGIVGTLVVGEIGSDVGHAGAGGDGIPLLSLTTIATVFLGIGVGGGAASLAGSNGIVAAIAAVCLAAILVLLTRGLLLPYLLRQQANSHTGRQSYIGLTGTVTLSIAPGGWGEVAFTDTEGNRVRSRAVTTESTVLPVNSRVYIGDVDGDDLHVVSIPDGLDVTFPLPESN